MPREIHAENNEHEQDVEDKAQRQSVLQDRPQTMKLKRQPIDEETVGHYEPNQRNEEEPGGGFRRTRRCHSCVFSLLVL